MPDRSRFLTAAFFAVSALIYTPTTARSVEFVEHPINASIANARGVAGADLDGDGDVDVSSASYDSNEIAWTWTIGSGIAPLSARSAA